MVEDRGLFFFSQGGMNGTVVIPCSESAASTAECQAYKEIIFKQDVEAADHLRARGFLFILKLCYFHSTKQSYCTISPVEHQRAYTSSHEAFKY